MTSAFTFVPDIPADKEAVIQSQLSEIERDYNVRFLFAIESGSRAWGFPSPDSDFAVRFVYARAPSWYLSLKPGRDVIELPLKDDWDINGWDIQKAITLLLKPNPVLLEWLSSPIHYRWDAPACKRLRAFADDYVRPIDCLTHYFHLARNTWTRNIQGETEVNLKKYFYVLRPVLAIRWVRAHPDRLPPMNFQDLINGTDVDAALQDRISDLLRAKAHASEVGAGARIDAVDSFITAELDWASQNFPKKQTLKESTREDANQLFRDLIGYKAL